MGVHWGDIGNWFPQSSPRKLVSSAPGPRQLCCPPGGPGCQGQCCSRFRCLIGRAPHRTIVAMIYTESKYKHNPSPPPHDLRLPPLSPMSCTSLPRRAPPLSPPGGGSVVCGDDVASSVQCHLPCRTPHGAVRSSARRDGAQVDASGDSFSAGVGPCASADRPNRTSAASMPLTCLYTRSL